MYETYKHKIKIQNKFLKHFFELANCTVSQRALVIICSLYTFPDT